MTIVDFGMIYFIVACVFAIGSAYCEFRESQTSYQRSSPGAIYPIIIGAVWLPLMLALALALAAERVINNGG